MSLFNRSILLGATLELVPSDASFPKNPPPNKKSRATNPIQTVCHEGWGHISSDVQKIIIVLRVKGQQEPIVFVEN